jgi:hypothetical protein
MVQMSDGADAIGEVEKSDERVARTRVLAILPEILANIIQLKNVTATH